MEEEYLEEYLVEKCKSTKRKNSKRLQDFSKSDKAALIESVKKERAIWDLQSKDHCNINAVNRAWSLVAAEVDKEVSECKIAWKAIRQSYRYHTNPMKKLNSGSSGGVSLNCPVLDEDSNNQWEFFENLSFLQETASKRRTFNSMQDPLVSDESNDGPSGFKQQRNYLYEKPKPKPKKDLSELKNQAILELVEVQKTLIASETSPKSPNQAFWEYLNELTKDLEKQEMQELQKQILDLVFVKVQERNSSNKI